jgi:hypothetical protein
VTPCCMARRSTDRVEIIWQFSTVNGGSWLMSVD